MPTRDDLYQGPAPLYRGSYISPVLTFSSVTRHRAIIISLLVIATGFFGATPIVNAETHQMVTDATRIVPMSYTVLAPLCTTFDALVVLSCAQHCALFGTLALIFLVWRLRARRRQSTSWRRELVYSLSAFALWFTVYCVGAAMPYPMSAIALRDPDDIAVDFHSHTNASWDGRRTFDVEHNRAWHTNAGFGAAYLSDHKTLAGVRRALRTNSPTYDGRTMLLPSLEQRDHSQHVNVLGIDSTFVFNPKGEWDDLPGDTSRAARAHAPLLLLDIPAHLATLPINETKGVARLAAIELSDAAPVGLNQIYRDERHILHLADSLNLAVVAGSNNHGWGSTAAAWSILHVPHWRTLNATQLDSAILHTIRTEGRHASRVYLRDTPHLGTPLITLVLIMPAIVWRMFVNLNWPMRASWIAWIWVIPFLHNEITRRVRKRVGHAGIWSTGRVSETPVLSLPQSTPYTADP